MTKYTLHHGDCIEVMRGFSADSVDLVVTSPPYNCRKDYGDFSDEIPWPSYYEWIGQVLKEIYRVLAPGGVVAVNVPGVVRWQADHEFSNTWVDFDPLYKNHRDGKKELGKGRIEPVGFRLFDMMREIDSHVREPIIWIKGSENNAITTEYRMGCDSDPYIRPAHEFILLGSKSRWYHRGGTGRRGAEAVPFLDETKDVWFISPESSRKHPAIFPVELPRRLIKLFTHAPDSIILDPFMGLGSTGVAAAELKREFIGIELNKKFIQEADKRIYTAAAQGELWESS